MSIEERVKKIIVEQLGVKEEDVKPEASFVEDLGADSLDTVELVMALEEEFDMRTIAIVCDKNLRYDRLSKRDVRPFNNEEAKKRDITEIENIEKAGPIAYADYYN